MGSIGPWQVIIILLVVVLLFGAKKLPQIGKGMGEALRNFKKSGLESAVDLLENRSGGDFYIFLSRNL